jgi:hypothetical protein
MKLLFISDIMHRDSSEHIGFGHSRHLSNGVFTHNYCSLYTCKSNYYRISLILWQLLFRQAPFFDFILYQSNFSVIRQSSGLCVYPSINCEVDDIFETALGKALRIVDEYTTESITADASPSSPILGTEMIEDTTIGQSTTTTSICK